MDTIASGIGGLRPSWLFLAVREYQIAIGDALEDADITSDAFRKRLPRPRTRLEQYVFDGMIVEASRRLDDSGRRAAHATSPAERAAHLIRRHVDRRWTVPELAKEAATNRHTLCCEFRKRFGTTPHAYLLRQRITVAQELIRSSSAKIEDIAITVGFRSAASFHRAYRRVTGSRPAHLRRR